MLARTRDRGGAGSRRSRRGGLLAGILASALASGPAARAADRVFVPTDASLADRWLARAFAALEAIAKDRAREGVEALQALLVEGGAPAPAAGRPVGAGAAHDDVLLTVAAGARRDLPALKESLLLARGPRPAAEPVPPVRLPLRREAPSGAGRRFLPRGMVARALLGALPPEAVRVYREVHEPLAERVHAEWERTGDPRLLERLAREYFLTRRGAEAAETLGDAAFEAGDLRSAISWWRSFVEESAGPPAAAARGRSKVLLGLRLLGEASWYALEKERFLVEREEVPALERGAPAIGPPAFVAAIESAVPLVPREERQAAPEPSRWGGELRFAAPPDLVPPRPQAPVPPAAGFQIPEPAFRLSWDSWVWSQEGLDSPLGGNFRHYPFRDLISSHHAFVPLADGDDVYLSGVFSLFRFDGKDGKGSLTQKYEKPVPRYLYGYKEESEAPLYSATLWKKSLEPGVELPGVPAEVLVTHFVSDRVKAENFMGYDITVDIPIRSLVAFDRERAEQLWHSPERRPPAEPAAVDDPGADEVADVEVGGLAEEEEIIDLSVLGVRGARSLDAENPDKGFSYTSPAVVKRGLVVAGGWIQRGYVRSVLRALDLASGRLVWETLLASAQLELTMFGEIAREPFAGAILEADGILYYLTQMGAVAAVDLETGVLRWVTTYDTIEVLPTFHRTAHKRMLSWGPNPLLLMGHVLIATPRDSQYLYAIDAGTGPSGALGGGRILWRVANPVRRDEAELRDFLGYWKGYLYFTGGEGVSALDVTGLDAEGRLPLGLVEPRRVKGPLAPALAESLAGAGALTSSGVVFADKDTLRVTSLDLQRTRDLMERPFRRSEWGSYAGRVSVAPPGRLLVASRQLLSAYVEKPPEPPPAVAPPAATGAQPEGLPRPKEGVGEAK